MSISLTQPQGYACVNFASETNNKAAFVTIQNAFIEHQQPRPKQHPQHAISPLLTQESPHSIPDISYSSARSFHWRRSFFGQKNAGTGKNISGKASHGARKVLPYNFMITLIQSIYFSCFSQRQLKKPLPIGSHCNTFDNNCYIYY